jgi:hypothetical protein
MNMLPQSKQVLHHLLRMWKHMRINPLQYKRVGVAFDQKRIVDQTVAERGNLRRPGSKLPGHVV